MGIISILKRLLSGISADKPKDQIQSDKGENDININRKGKDEPFIKGFEFCATLQLRIPLRVLMRHGEVHTGKKTKLPKIAAESWEGCWLPKTKTYRELGIDIDEMKTGVYASDVGPVMPGDYLPFLIAIRKIIELDEPIEDRIRKLHEMPILEGWKIYIEKHGGMERIIEKYFPRFINTIPTLSLSTVSELSKLGLDTPNRITNTPDKKLLSIKGIGQAKLKAIRDYCAAITENRDADRIENVNR